MSTTVELPFGAQLIGQTENALSAIIESLLAETGVRRDQWIALRVASSTSAQQQITRLASTFQEHPDSAGARLDELIAAGLLQRDGELTQAGRDLINNTVPRTDAVAKRLWGDLPAGDLDIAGRVLRTVLTRASAGAG
ncbi:MAG: hypothetical protein J2O48_05220 [Solirubrobacterales bacterium]|nr:hypothetical protein [Solirubrobacterales bacterium]